MSFSSHNQCDLEGFGVFCEVAADLSGKSIDLGYVRMLRSTSTMEIYLVCLLPPSVPKSSIEVTHYDS